MTRVLLVHGAATASTVWDRVLPHLRGLDVVALDRPRTGSLLREVSWLAEQARDTWVVGVSGGATLGLALAATGLPLHGAILHEPAVGSLVPGLLLPVASAFERGGTSAFARQLYGPSWQPVPDATWLDDAVTARELAMFRSFEPTRVASWAAAWAGRVVSTVGEHSPPVRHRAAAALTAYGVETVVVPGAAHFAPWDAPEQFASVVRGIVAAG